MHQSNKQSASRQYIRSKRREWLINELFKAYKKAALGKMKTPEVQDFRQSLYKNLKKLAKEIHEQTYQPLPSKAFIIHRPIQREIFAAAFRDRVVHHFLFNQVNDWWDRRFIDDNYSCRKNKGTLYGIRRLRHHMESVSQNYTKTAYVLKLDLQGYFMSLDRKLLYKRAIWGLDRQFPERGYVYQRCRYLWQVIIFNDPLKNVQFACPRSAWRGLPNSKSLFRQPKGKGIAIGNLTSQLLSNIFLDQLDRFVSYDLGYKHYGRYVDDFYMISLDKSVLFEARSKIKTYLEQELKLTLHPHKQHLQTCDKGVEFLGAVVYPFRIQPGKRLKRNLWQALTAENVSPETEASYFGLVKHYRHHKLLEKVVVFRTAYVAS